jgi:tRNA threonylcarbamoyladenosine biosynthesis protein TsaB
MITLAIDTSDSRGSVAVLGDGELVHAKLHDDASDYSAWLLDAVNVVLVAASASLGQVDLFAVSNGPGSFTGLRVGLTAVKAWAVVFGRPIVSVSRLETLARSSHVTSTFIASCYDAHREQLFGGLYRHTSAGIQKIGDERVTSPADFVAEVSDQAHDQHVSWVCLDPELIQNLDSLKRRLVAGDTLVPPPAALAPVIGRLAVERAARHQFSDPVLLDANYVRRSDAEIFWKGGPGGVP